MRYLKRKIDDLVKIPVTECWKDGEIFNVILDGSDIIVEVDSVSSPLLM